MIDFLLIIGKVDHNFKYEFTKRSSSDQQQIMVAYALIIIIGVIAVAIKLRGYNRAEQVLNIAGYLEGNEEKMAIPAVAYIVGACITAVLLWFVTRSRSDSSERRDGDRPRGVPQQRRQLDAPVPRRRRNIQDRIQETQEDNRSGSDEEKELEKNKNIGTKKLRKLQDKEHKKQMRLEAEREREEAKKRREEQEKLQKEEEERKLVEEKKKEEEERKIREEKEKKEHEEYLKMKAMFEVEEEGQQELSNEEESKNLLAEFIEYIKTKKVVMLEDLASHFGMRTQDAIERVQTLLKEETITGVIDDRGKFIYISLDELKAVAKFIRQRGRVSISELAQASNKLIDFNKETKIQLATHTTDQ